MTNVIEAETKAQDYNREMVGNRYQHFKGNIYEVDHIGVDTRDLALVVVYHEQYHPVLILCRPLEEFLSPVDHEKYPEAGQKYRYEKI